MIARARQSIYWPGIERDINNHIKACQQCREVVPSYLKEPLIPSPISEYPFQQVAADLFEINGNKYLAYVDRLTGFIELAHFPSSTSSAHIIDTLRELFHRWGVAEQISLDGGQNLSSYEIKEWLNSWGVSIRTHLLTIHSLTEELKQV